MRASSRSVGAAAPSLSQRGRRSSGRHYAARRSLQAKGEALPMDPPTAIARPFGAKVEARSQLRRWSLRACRFGALATHMGKHRRCLSFSTATPFMSMYPPTDCRPLRSRPFAQHRHPVEHVALGGAVRQYLCLPGASAASAVRDRGLRQRESLPVGDAAPVSALRTSHEAPGRALGSVARLKPAQAWKGRSVQRFDSRARPTRRGR